jgi:hypothetical protein
MRAQRSVVGRFFKRKGRKRQPRAKAQASQKVGRKLAEQIASLGYARVHARFMPVAEAFVERALQNMVSLRFSLRPVYEAG